MKNLILPKYYNFLLTCSLSSMIANICFSYILQPKMDELMPQGDQIVSETNVEIKKITAIKSVLNKLMDFDHESIDGQADQNIYPIESKEKKLLSFSALFHL